MLWLGLGLLLLLVVGSAAVGFWTNRHQAERPRNQRAPKSPGVDEPAGPDLGRPAGRSVRMPLNVTITLSEDWRDHRLDEDEALPADGYAPDFFGAPIVAAELEFTYADRDGMIERRRVTVAEYVEKGDGFWIRGHCHLRGARRTFSSARMSDVVDVQTGEAIADAVAFMKARYETTADAALDRISQARCLMLPVLMHVATADGRLSAAQREVLRDVVRQWADNHPDLSTTVVDRWLRACRDGSVHTFRRGVGDVLRADAGAGQEMLELAERVAAAQTGKGASVEAEAVDYIRKRIASFSQEASRRSR